MQIVSSYGRKLKKQINLDERRDNIQIFFCRSINNILRCSKIYELLIIILRLALVSINTCLLNNSSLKSCTTCDTTCEHFLSITRLSVCKLRITIRCCSAINKQCVIPALIYTNRARDSARRTLHRLAIEKLPRQKVRVSRLTTFLDADAQRSRLA